MPYQVYSFIFYHKLVYTFSNVHYYYLVHIKVFSEVDLNFISRAWTDGISFTEAKNCGKEGD